MKSLVNSLAGASYINRAQEKQNVSNLMRTKGTPSNPQAPRDVQLQPATGGVLATWKLPAEHDNVAGWRVYINTESNLAAQIRDKGTRQQFIPLSSGVSPASVNVMVSSFTTLGRESAKVVKTAAPLSQTTATIVPTVPPGYTDEQAGGANRSLIRFNGESQYINS